MPAHEAPVLVLAPIGRDAEGTVELLEKHGFKALPFRTMESLCQAITEEAGALIVTEEAFSRDSLSQLLSTLEKQPLWSDLPIIILTRPATMDKSHGVISIGRMAEELGNVMFLERPLHTLTLVSAVRACLKARKRQFQSREDAESLKEYAARLIESNRELEQFAYIASHDLQAPLRKVSFFSDMIEQLLTSEANPEVLDLVRRMKTSVNRMQQMVSDLLQLSRIHRQSKEFEPVNLATILQTVSDDLLEYRREMNGMIEYDSNLNITLMGDPGQLHQVFQNLLQNSLKFHRKDARPVVQISARQEGACAIITIKDNGIGFKPEHAERIFETFQRLHGQAEYPGTGIGLSIVKKIVERHQGSIRVESQPGEGSKFILTLPVAQNASIATLKNMNESCSDSVQCRLNSQPSNTLHSQKQ